MKVTRKNKNIKNNTPFYLLLLAIVFFLAALAFKAFGLIFISGFLLLSFFVLRLLFGELRLADEDVILFWGLPGSGKTMFLSKVARSCKAKGWKIAGNDAFCACSKYVDYNYDKRYMSVFRPLPHTVLFIDEASLNGWDNREWAKNFTPLNLDFWKKHRQYECPIVLSNQGFNELDCKIRDTLTTSLYYVENKGKYSRAVRMDRNATFDENGIPIEGYKMPSLLSRVFDPSSVLYVWHSKEGKHFKSNNPLNLPLITSKDRYDLIYDKFGNVSRIIEKPAALSVSLDQVGSNDNVVEDCSSGYPLEPDDSKSPYTY